MISTTTIRAELEDYIRSEGTTLHHFAEFSGVNVGTLSGILNGNRPIAIGQLDRITTAMGLSEGYFYDLYVNECFNTTAPHWRRLRPFLLRCAEMNRLDCISQVLNLLLEDLKQLTGIFETAEMMLEQGWKEAAVILYEGVIESERSSHSERLAMSYYRLFQIYQADGRKGFKAALQFLPYRYRLPEAFALDGLLMLIEIYAIRMNWVEVENYADELSNLSLTLYEKHVWKQEDFKPFRSLALYYGKAYLFKSGTYEYRGMYEESRKWIAKYADLSWFEGLDEEGIAEVEQFKLYAKINYICVDIKSGDRSRISEYIAFLEEHPGEIIEGLITLIESANRHDFNIDAVIEKFSAEIEQYKLSGKKDNWFNQRAVTKDYNLEPSYLFRCSVFFQNYSIYHIRKGLYKEGMDHILHSLKMSTTLNSKDLVVNCMILFELHRQFATEEQCTAYFKICERVWEHEKENILAGFGYSNV